MSFGHVATAIRSNGHQVVCDAAGKDIYQPVREDRADGQIESAWMHGTPEFFSCVRVVRDRCFRRWGDQLPFAIEFDQLCGRERLVVVARFLAPA